MAYIYPFRMASGTATMLVIDPVKKKFLNGIRNRKAWVYPGHNSLPGGFMEARFTVEHAEKLGDHYRIINESIELVAEEFHEGENLEQCAIRELQEELNTTFTPEQLHMFAVRSNSRTDTRAHVINVCYWMEATPEQIATIEAGDDLEGVDWVDFDAILENPMEMAFNHMEVTYQGLRAYCRHVVTEHLLEQALADGHRNVTDFFEMDGRLAKLEREAANG